jgi:glycosyltransferase involved in cell wall biosynthesis
LRPLSEDHPEALFIHQLLEKKPQRYEENLSKIRIAIIKYGGLSAGGTEKFLQTIAVNLNQEIFDVTYFYCDSSPYVGSNFSHPNTDPNKLSYLQDSGVKLVKFNVRSKNTFDKYHKWEGTDFWDKFKETDFDLIQTGRAGHPEYPFHLIKKVPIIDSIHLNAGVDNQVNIAKVMLLGEWSLREWIKNGGDSRRAVVISHPIEPTEMPLSIRSPSSNNPVIFGFHQRKSDEIFSEIPLQAFSQLPKNKALFRIMGGSDLYREQATKLGLDNVEFMDFSSDQKRIENFLNTLDVYAHGRKDGEINSTAIAEALRHGKPIISHISSINNGHIECIGPAGKVVKSPNEYTEEMRRYLETPSIFSECALVSLEQFKNRYELSEQIKKISSIYKDIYQNGYPKTSIFRIVKLKISAKFRRLFHH